MKVNTESRTLKVNCVKHGVGPETEASKKMCEEKRSLLCARLCHT